MSKMRTLSAVVFLSTTLVSPALAQDAWGLGSHRGWDREPVPYHNRSCIQGPGFGEPCPGRLFGWSVGRDRSRVGGVAPSLRPSGS
jgi:hypothetical protein